MMGRSRSDQAAKPSGDAQVSGHYRAIGRLVPASVPNHGQSASGPTFWIAPPAHHLSRNVTLGSQRQQFPVHGRTALPLLELDGAQPMTQPLVELSPDPWGLRQPEVRLPSPNVGPQMIHHILHTAPA